MEAAVTDLVSIERGVDGWRAQLKVPVFDAVEK
jgi:hypothetical protein